jgi:hypothetical protein
MFRRHLVLATILTVTAPTLTWTADAQFRGQVVVQWGSQGALQNAYHEGYDRGVRAGEIDGRRGGNLRFSNQPDYRQGDFGYRLEFGNRDRYRSEFRRGFEAGYRTSFSQYNRREGQGQWNNGRFDPAAQIGFNDGYDAGLKDARDRNRFDPIAERRYRSGDHGYERQYGSKDRYKDVYRNAFRDGYEQAYRQNDDYGRR